MIRHGEEIAQRNADDIIADASFADAASWIDDFLSDPDRFVIDDLVAKAEHYKDNICKVTEALSAWSDLRREEQLSKVKGAVEAMVRVPLLMDFALMKWVTSSLAVPCQAVEQSAPESSDPQQSESYTMNLRSLRGVVWRVLAKLSGYEGQLAEYVNLATTLAGSTWAGSASTFQVMGRLLSC
eukprot:6433541-Pyramimonas_sp.AAC.2